VGFEFRWDEKKVWELDLPVEEIDINELTWHFEIPFWNRYTLTAREVQDHPELWREEYERTMQADLTYPIDIKWHKGRWVIMDGLHRLLKASILDLKTVQVRKLQDSHLPFIMIHH